MIFPNRAGPYEVRVSSAYGFLGPHLVLHGQMFMKSSEISQKNHQILRKITIQIPIKITHRNPYQSPFFVSSTVLPIWGDAFDPDLLGSGARRRGRRGGRWQPRGGSTPGSAGGVGTCLGSLEISMGIICLLGDWNHGFSWLIFMVNLWLILMVNLWVICG